jgi:hypothetical protein
MVEYERARRIQVSPDEVFAFVADIRNFPAYLPTVQSADSPAEDRVAIEGRNDGHGYRDDGWIHVDTNRRRLEWGDDERNYSGWMSVSGEDGATEVVAHLSFPPHFDASGRPLSGEASEEPDPIEESLEAAMESLRNLLEGRDGKETPPPS